MTELKKRYPIDGEKDSPTIYQLRLEDLNRLELFLARVNKVTCPFRHGQVIPQSALVKLSNEQIDMENWLKQLRGKDMSSCAV